MSLILNFFRIWIYALRGLGNKFRKLPPDTIIVIHGSWIGEKSESFLHARTVANLYKKYKKRISYIIPSGYDANVDVLETEGEYMTELLIESGVPFEIILTETKALTTTENIIRSISLLAEKGIDSNSFNIIPVHRPSYIWKTYYLWNLYGYKIKMAIASVEPMQNFLKNLKQQYKNIDAFLKNPIQNELETAHLRSTTRTHFGIQPVSKDVLENIRSKNTMSKF